MSQLDMQQLKTNSLAQKYYIVEMDVSSRQMLEL
jgi:hypothetical protein